MTTGAANRFFRVTLRAGWRFFCAGQARAAKIGLGAEDC